MDTLSLLVRGERTLSRTTFADLRDVLHFQGPFSKSRHRRNKSSSKVPNAVAATSADVTRLISTTIHTSVVPDIRSVAKFTTNALECRILRSITQPPLQKNAPILLFLYIVSMCAQVSLAIDP